ncbi:MAG: Ni/Fe hydrogenase subunit gamma, partial [Armatimonadota bacterium]|nr:Ni/Fe hydrogenase subunit gamma [Armatimonadota bacterium]
MSAVAVGGSRRPDVAHPMVPHAAAITAVRPEAPGVATYTLQFRDPAIRGAYRFRPGQFNMLSLPGIGESAISISSDPLEPAALQHTVRVAGTVTQAIARLAPGDLIGVRGPYGTPWPVDRAMGQDLIIVAGGIGMAPLRPAIYHLIRHREQFGRIHLLI